MRGKHKERIKSAALLALIVLLLVQLRITWTYKSGGEMQWPTAFGQLFGTGSAAASEEVTFSAYPTELAVYGENGFYARRSGEVQTDFDSILPIFRNALQNAERFTQTVDFGEDLNRPLVYIKYNGQIPLALFCDWCGSSRSEQDLTLGGLMVVQGEDGRSRIYLRDSRNQKLYVAKTTVEERSFSEATGLFSAGGGGFAWQLQYDSLQPEMIILDHEKYSILSAMVPAFDDTDSQNSKQKLLEAFQYNPYTVKSYQEDNGTTTVFVENQSTLSLQADGTVIFEANSLGGGIEPTSDAERTMKECSAFAAQLVQAVLDSMGGGQAALTAVESDGESTGFLFGRMISGVPVDDTVHGFFARLNFQNGSLIQAELHLRQYQETGEVLGLMPGKQLAEMVDRVGEISVRYTDTGEQRMIPRWKQTQQQEEEQGAME